MLTHVTLEYIGPSTGHNFVQPIPGVTTFSFNDLLTPLSLWQKEVLYECLWIVSPFLKPGIAAALGGYAELLAAFSHVS